MSATQSYSLFELNEYIKRVIALNFNEPVWIKCEISQVNEVRGNWYLDLVEKEETSDTVIAQSSAVIWYKSFLFIKRKLGDLSNSILQNGTEILVKVKIDFNERYGLKLLIEDIDPSYTIGQLEMNRQKILDRLKQQDVIEINRQHTLPQVIQRIAVISSSTAAGYKDFCKQLEHNPYAYSYRIELYDASMQGQNTERTVVEALRAIEKEVDQFDVIAIIRGGGSKLDLAAFDNYNIAYTIAQSSLPVIVGIGHEIDTSITDLVAHTSLKTPTAVADYLIETSLHFESNLIEIGRLIAQSAREDLKQNELHVQSLEERLSLFPRQIIRQHKEEIAYISKSIMTASRNYLHSTNRLLEAYNQQLTLADPAENLKKGYALVKLNGSLVKGKIKEAGQLIEIEFKDGSTKAITQK